MSGYTMREIPVLLEHFRRAEAREDLRLLAVRGLPYISEEHERDAAYNELIERAYGGETKATNDGVPTYLPPTKPDVAAMRAFAAGGNV